MPRLRLSFTSMRSRIAVALVAMSSILLLLAGYAVSLTFADGWRLRDVEVLRERIYSPVVQLIDQLQRERRLSVDLISRPSASRDEIEARRAQIQRAATAFREVSDDESVRSAGGLLPTRVDAFNARLSGLNDHRKAVDRNAVNRRQAADAFTGAIDAALLVLDAMPANAVPGVSDQQRALTALQRAREALDQRVTLLAGALNAGDLTTGEYPTFLAMRGAQEYLLATPEAYLAGEQLADYQRTVQGPAFERLRRLEDAVSMPPEAEKASLPFSAATWTETAAGPLDLLRDLHASLVQELIESVRSDADTVLIRAWSITIGGVILIIGLVIVWIFVAPRHVLGQLGKLQRTALTLADVQLPELVGRLKRGEPVDMSGTEGLTFGPDEFGHVGRAIVHLGREAMESTVATARQRSLRDVLVSLARRAQVPVHQQLKILRELERRAGNPEELTDLFELDLAANQLRRLTENLIILAGAAPGRQFRKPVRLMDVIRSAAGEVRDYKRVTVTNIEPPASLHGRAVADVIHLLAELIENATRYSPPHTAVQVVGQAAGRGFVVEIEDRGIGMTDDDLVLYNERLATSPDPFGTAIDSVKTLGLYVVGQLARRHRIQITLRTSAYGGTSAIVLIPAELVEAAAEIDGRRSDAATAGSTARQPAGAEPGVA